MNAKVVLWGGGRRRRWKRDALMIAGAAGLATAIGAMTAGRKGALYGGISGGTARWIMRMFGR
jgi:hypothetical protein